MQSPSSMETHQVSPSVTGRVLIADDQTPVLDALQLLLKGRGYATEAVTHPARVLSALESGQFDAVLMDLNYTLDTTAGGEGLELVSQIRSKDRLLPVVVMTAWGSVDLAVEAMQRGASDFVQKPWENGQLLEKLHTQVSQVRAQRWAERQRADELREAREIQENLLPKKLPEVADYEIAGMTQPVRFVGGDYYNVVRISEQHTVLCIADVSGKGLPAALLMSSLQAALKPLMWQKLAPRELCRRLNRMLCDLTPLGKFISFFYAVLDGKENRLTYCNAGHNPPLLIRSNGMLNRVECRRSGVGTVPRLGVRTKRCAIEKWGQIAGFHRRTGGSLRSGRRIIWRARSGSNRTGKPRVECRRAHEQPDAGGIAALQRAFSGRCQRDCVAGHLARAGTPAPALPASTMLP